MPQLPCQGCRGMCCGPVPITESELKRIRKYVRGMPLPARSKLEGQLRFFGTCIFYDQDQDKCGIHPARPAVCRAFGLHRNLVCFRMPEAASGEAWAAGEPSVGVLSADFVWNDFK
ncbi:YkgJ family cysteine cluster protein [Cohnella nanjingensis]|uniref:YkgJ family cysteine cluster protein n=1 Tax=Cohnella nanjingensis TaxID=1387779 RepID=A0A7X0RUG7_9BACL|nr:YkgJ family cysteine cluster protein [Cohnella nanjingensis]MBB6672706.1 YkgJ family cysteine cluster protein [Cohnella nanjingensis]